MGEFFGTDGIRGVANEYPMTPEIALKVGRVVGLYFGDSRPSAVVIGRDTRISGPMIEAAIVAGCCSVGVDVLKAGIMPTPGVAYLTRTTAASAGIVVSASHNPYSDNGIKLFDAKGFKLSEEIEATLEKHILHGDVSTRIQTGAAIGKVAELAEDENTYKNHLKSRFANRRRLTDLKIVLDCANGATYRIAPELFADLGASVEALFRDPDGRNINQACGSQHTQSLTDKVKASAADLGLAFDGDGDRLIAVDETGVPLSGDEVLAICAEHLKERGRLTKNIVVATVMSNMGLGLALRQLGIELAVTPVGDRHVVEEMRRLGAVLGGEESGHTVFLSDQTTGDGMLTALKLLEIVATKDSPLSDLRRVMTVFPQVMINVDVTAKPPLDAAPQIRAVINAVEKELDGNGRVLVRYSGTQPQCRVMVEGPTEEETRRHCERIAQVIRDTIGPKTGGANGA
jgi:phosphoglucosamine mutase